MPQEVKTGDLKSNVPLFVACPSYRGAEDDEIKALIGADRLEQAGFPCGIAVVKGMAHLDLARAELQALYYKNVNFPLLLWQDDDVAVHPDDLVAMLQLMTRRADVDVLVAPYKLRFSGERGAPEGEHCYGLWDQSEAVDADGLVTTSATGLGCVIVRRSIVELLYRDFGELLSFPSEIASDTMACGVFNSMVVTRPGSKTGERMFLGDDRSWSHRLGVLDVKIWAYVEARTNHRGIYGHLGAELRGQKVERWTTVERTAQPSGLVGASGKPL